MVRKNSKSGQKPRGRVTRDLPIRNAKNGKDAKGGAGGIQVALGDGSVRTVGH